MIIQTSFNLLLFLFLSLRSMEISKNCVCGHVRIQEDCQNSGFCIWQNNACMLNYGQTYNNNEDSQNQKTCKNFAEEDCRLQQQCGFYLGQCITFQDCSIFNQDSCQESSFRCVSDGTKCVEIKDCNSYKTNYGCSNKDQNGKYCFWDEAMENKCRDVIICEELPIYLVNHFMCKEGLDGCTVNDLGYGCIKQMDECTKYYNDSQCFESQEKIENCFWDSLNKKCVDKICENLPFSSDYECQSYLSGCTTNGIHCIQRKQCSDVQNKFGCVKDAQENKCEYHQNQCKIKSCNTASDSLINYQQCQDYDNLLDCVISENGGCKQRPETCEGYADEIDCYSIQQEDCIWQNNKCWKRKCYHAPVHYGQAECKLYGNCIGKVDGGCKETPQICDEISEKQFCEFNYNQERCIWLDDECTLLECNKLKLPTYNSHQACQKASQFCTFKLDSYGCDDYLCENIFEIEYCSIDSTGTICVLNQGCIDKKCSSAPKSYDNNQLCQEWLPYCTVNVQFLSNSKILIGCINKLEDCHFALEEQCYSTFAGINCKWDSEGKRCIYQVCTDADPDLYLNNEDCNSFKVKQGICILGPYDIGCQQWPNSCSQLLSQFQCSLNLQDGTSCFWTGSSCKTLECTDASKIDYTNNIECNSWIDYCIYDSISGGCRNRPISEDCTSSPNNSMYDTHLECIVWNPKCTVVSTFNAEGCELKKANCFEFIRQRNCKTSLSGSNCYWDDNQQKCFDESGDNDCNKRIYGDLSHQDCETFLSKCTVSLINSVCVTLSLTCDYPIEQQCVIRRDQQPCRWDYKNKLCKDLTCKENVSALTEEECLKQRKFNQCQLKIQSNGTFGPGCESRPQSCELITNPTICKLTLTSTNQRCYYFNFKCQVVLSSQCEVIQESKSNELCQLYNSNCILQQSGKGCYSIYRCEDLTHNICNNAIMKFNYKCIYSDYCSLNNDCSNKQLFTSTCDNIKTGSGQKCYLYSYCYKYCCDYQCLLQTAQITMQFYLFTSLQERRQLCQNYSSNYKYDTNCQCCVYMTSCAQQESEQQLCNSSTANSNLKCGFNFQTNKCETRKCEHLTYANYPVITNHNCYDWKYDCVLGIAGCTIFTGDCTQIKLIYQCYSQQCFWQDGKCLNHVDCQINTTAITDRECLLANAEYCRFNYIKGIGCSFYNCSHIINSTICNSSTLVDEQNCIQISNLCKSKTCSDYTLQADCENSYGSYYSVVTKCFWCTLNTIKCSNFEYCSSSSLVSPESHNDCYKANIFSTINFTASSKCTIKKQFCSQYTYEDACISTINGQSCYWSSNLCVDICSATTSPLSTHLECFNWHSECMSNGASQCQDLNCASLSTNIQCNIFTAKCFWNGSNCQTVGACTNYSTSSLCLDTKNSKGIPCFWNGIFCTEKTCYNKPTPSTTQLDCHNWLKNCQLYNNACLEDCTQADITYITHNQCESFYYNKSCTVKLDIIQCVDLPISCNYAKKTQCYVDKDGNQCYFNVSSNQCVNLICEILAAPFISHQKCNQKLKDCTVNASQSGCQQLNDCSSYSIPEQCQIDQNNVECEWIFNQNKCTIKECSTAQLNIYTAYSCRQYFGDSCTVNANLDRCEIGQEFCRNYTQEQCTSNGQINLNKIDCFWNLEKNMCQEKICENGPTFSQNDSECTTFLHTCQKGGCRIKGCLDYYYAIDQACASLFEDKRCVTNGKQCVYRTTCENINMIDGCTYDKNLNPCIWINHQCYTKTCETASISLVQHEECNSYLQHCTVKQEGGCTRKQRCQDYKIKEACQTDSENAECIWDDNLNQCFFNQCFDFCGNGIVSTKDEYCDDGNYLPYDGCYKCEVQCPLGCQICKGKLCQECYKIGWYLVEGVCITKCGDGYVVGSEQCDDGNNTQFDGCYQCSYQCHQKCLNCFQGRCLECEKGYQEDGPFCHHICGDGYLVKELEQCDDGNLNNYDGCSSNCNIEQNWKCLIENNFSSCTYIIQPKIILTKQTKTYTKKVRLNDKAISEEQFLQLIIIEILNANKDQYDIEIKPMISITTDLADVAYKLLVNFKTDVKNPVLKVIIYSGNIVNFQENSLHPQEAKLELRSPYKISDDQQSLLSRTTNFSKIVLNVIIIVSGISCLFGNLEILWNLLDLLQQLSYMKFHNLEFPVNLQDYFEVFDIGSFTPMISKLQIDIYLQNIFNFSVPVIKAKWKFEFYQINCYFLQNFETLLMMIIMGLTYFILSYQFYKLLILIKYQNWSINFQINHQNFIFKVIKIVFFIQRFARKYYQYFIYSGLIRILTSNFYELTFAAILQLVNTKLDTTFNKIIYFLALITLIFNIFLIISFFRYLSQKKKVAKNLSVLVEGIRNVKFQGLKQYFTILLIKKTLFILNLIVFQGLAVAQSLITACIFGIFFCYIFFYKPFENKFENIKIYCTEFLIMMNVTIFSFYEFMKLNQISETAQLIGWINIGGFTLILILTLVIDTYQQLFKYFKFAKERWRLRKEAEQKRKQKILFF
ncbi:unnamed protein product [Paramecium sonneborni]|uniref:Uncharacterized protein n=1 Tax=Paramecium sonneborni TaxID=65129 RepID=A0A8S1PK28_9CILI|nr:unnamed protein product [Paramecium sonneborni]